MTRAGVFAAFTAAAALAAGLGAGEAAAVASHASAAKVTKVKVTLVEFKLTTSVKSAAASKITFVVHNAGHIPHEFVVIRTNKPAGKLPMRGPLASETGKVGKIGSFGPGKTKMLTLTLKKGHYALICNMPGHYMAGQHSDFTVR